MNPFKISLYNTIKQKKEVFVPIDKNNIRMYVCGPTVYDHIHIGNARPLIIFDILFRLLRYVYGKHHVTYVRNITDIDDKINARALKEYPNLSINDAIKCLTERTNIQFQNDATLMNCLSPNIQPLASEHIHHIKDLIEILLRKGHAYIAQDHVLFSVASLKSDLSYGNLSKKTLSQMRAGARIEVANYKRDPMDFVLWKPSAKNEPGWPSPANISVDGRPGWHIECSAMSIATLLKPFGGGSETAQAEGNVFDIHGGGLDLIFPHHENEIAQTCSALGSTQMARYWVHNGFLLVEGRKMSKSLGNFLTIQDILEQKIPLPFVVNPEEGFKKNWLAIVLRLAILQTYYRSPLDWTQERFMRANEELYRWYKFLYENGSTYDIDLEGDENIIKSLCDDLNTAEVLTILRAYYKRKDFQSLAKGLAFLGLLPKSLYAEGCKKYFLSCEIDLKYIETKIYQRSVLLDNKDWKKADLIRDELKQKGIILQDSKDPNSQKRITNWSYI